MAVNFAKLPELLPRGNGEAGVTAFASAN